MDLKVGDKIRIIKEPVCLCCQPHFGDVYEVSRVSTKYPTFDAGGWGLMFEDEGTGWEKVED